MKYNLKISHETNGLMSIQAVNAPGGDTTGYLVDRCMCTLFVSVCVRQYRVRLVCCNLV